MVEILVVVVGDTNFSAEAVRSWSYSLNIFQFYASYSETEERTDRLLSLRRCNVNIFSTTFDIPIQNTV